MLQLEIDTEFNMAMIIGSGITIGGGITLSQVSSSGVVTSGLVLNLDAGNSSSYPGTGTTWTDLSPSGNNGSLYNSPTYTATNGGGLVFNGSNYVNLTSTITLTGDFTINWWEYLTGSISNNQGIIFSSTNSNDINHFGGQVRFYAPGDQGISPTTTSANTWYNWCYVRSGTTLSLYLNGASNTSGTVSVSTAYVSQVARGNGGGMTGTLPTIQVYSRAISPTEVTQNFTYFRSRYGV